MPLVELHVHTKAGSADSSITVDALGERAREMGTAGLVVTEHFRVWSEWEREAFERRWGVRLYPAMEVTTELGHVIVLGVESEARLPGEAEPLLALAAERGWLTIAAHPFRHYFDRVHASQRPVFAPELDARRLAEHPHLRAVDAIETENAACTERENALAAAVAALLGKPATAGSDAHDIAAVGARRMALPSLPAYARELGDLLRAVASPTQSADR